MSSHERLIISPATGQPVKKEVICTRCHKVMLLQLTNKRVKCSACCEAEADSKAPRVVTKRTLYDQVDVTYDSTLAYFKNLLAFGPRSHDFEILQIKLASKPDLGLHRGYVDGKPASIEIMSYHEVPGTSWDGIANQPHAYVRITFDRKPRGGSKTYEDFFDIRQIRIRGTDAPATG